VLYGVLLFMLTKEQMLQIQDKTPDPYKYFFKYHEDEFNAEEYVKDGKPNIELIEAKHLEIVKELKDWHEEGDHGLLTPHFERLSPLTYRLLAWECHQLHPHAVFV
jgi:hypothetical protein